jgi:hypothetical protein
MEEPLNDVSYRQERLCLSTLPQTRKKQNTELVAQGDDCNAFSWRTKFPAMFRGIVGIFSGVLTFLCICSAMLAETVTIFHDTLVGKRCLGSWYDIFLSV